MNSNSPESSQQLHYPPIRVNHSLARLDLNTLMMRSNQSRQPEEAHSSLEDSSYEVLGESLCDPSDDEGNTESLASTTPDDVSSISDGDEFDDDEYLLESSQQLLHSTDDRTTDHLDNETSSPDDSMNTSMVDTQTGEASYIKLQETAAEDGNYHARGVINNFSEARGLPHVLRGYGRPEITLAVRMSLSERYLPVSRSYRILYIGEFPEWGVKEINARIGAALDATPSSSRFNIVQSPTYPGSPSSSNVQLERSGPELVVDHCTTPKTLGNANSPSKALITLNDGTELTFGPGKTIAIRGDSGSASLPDLVIFCHYTVSSSSQPGSDTESIRVARTAFTRHGIPSMDIATTRPYGLCPNGFAFDVNSLRLCVEGRKTHLSDYEIQETLPIDIYAFSSIDPSQLNRHLEFISPHSSRSASRHEKSESRSWSIKPLFRASSKGNIPLGVGDLWGQPRLLLALIALSTMITIYLSGLTPVGLLPQLLPEQSVPSVSSSATLLPTSILGSVTEAPQPVVHSHSPALVRPISRDLTVLPGRTRPNKNASKDDISGGFEIEVQGDHRFLVRPAKHHPSSKRKVQLDIQVSRESKAVPVQIVRSPGNHDVYVITLEQEYSIGHFNVSVAARRKPLFQQSFEIELGVPKSRFTDLLRVTTVGQLNLWNMSTQISKAVQARMSALEESAVTIRQTRFWKESIEHSTQSVADHFKEAKKEAARRLIVGSKASKEISNTLWKSCNELALRGQVDFWKISAPLRSSVPVQRFRNNAKTLRKKFGKKNFRTTSKRMGKCAARGKGVK